MKIVKLLCAVFLVGSVQAEEIFIQNDWFVDQLSGKVSKTKTVTTYTDDHFVSEYTYYDREGYKQKITRKTTEDHQERMDYNYYGTYDGNIRIYSMSFEDTHGNLESPDVFMTVNESWSGPYKLNTEFEDGGATTLFDDKGYEIKIISRSYAEVGGPYNDITVFSNEEAKQYLPLSGEIIGLNLILDKMPDSFFDKSSNINYIFEEKDEKGSWTKRTYINFAHPDQNRTSVRTITYY